MENPIINEKNQFMPVLFKPNNWLVKIDFINHLIQLSNILMVVLAKPVSGKTAFVSLLSQSLENKTPYCIVTATETLAFSNLVEAMQESFFDTNIKDLTFTDLITQINLEKKHHLLIIDSAEQLSFYMLKDLLVELICSDKENYFHICLVGNFSLFEPLSILEKEQRFKDIIHTIELYPLTENETKAYFLNKLPPNSNISNQMLDELFQQTKGDLALINSKIAEQGSKVVALEKTKTKSRKFLHGTSLAASFFVVCSLSIYFWYNEQSVVEDTHIAANSTLVLPPTSKIPSYKIAAVEEPVSPPPLNRVVDLQNSDEESAVLEKLVVRDSVLGAPEQNYRAYAKPSLSSTTIAELSNAMAKKAKELVQVNELITEKLAKVTEPAVILEAKKGYTIQVLATQSRKHLNQFLAANSLKSKGNIHIANRQGKDWFVLTLGEFNQRKDAKEVMQALPKNLANLHPWVRPLSDFKA